jgi:hypothetical protein
MTFSAPLPFDMTGLIDCLSEEDPA